MEPLNERQLHTILEAISAKRPSSVERVLQFLQILSLVCVAAWTLMQYLSYSRPDQKLKLQQEIFEFQETQEGRISGLAQASIKPSEKKDLAMVTLSLQLTNTSRNLVEVSWVLVQCYLGSISDAKNTGLMPLRVNQPPLAFIRPAEEGPVQWKDCGYVGFFYPGSEVEKRLKESDYKFSSGGGGTKQLLPGDSSGLTDYYLVKRNPGQWIGLVVIVGLDRATEGKGLYHVL